MKINYNDITPATKKIEDLPVGTVLQPVSFIKDGKEESGYVMITPNMLNPETFDKETNKYK